MGLHSCVNIKTNYLRNSFYNIWLDIPVFRMLLQHNDSPYLEVSRLGRYLILGFCIILSTIAVRRAQLHNHELHSCKQIRAFHKTTVIYGYSVQELNVTDKDKKYIVCKN